MRNLRLVVAGTFFLVACGGESSPSGPGSDGGPLDGGFPPVTTACGGAEGAPLTVVRVTPTDGATDVDVGSQVFVELSHPLNLASVDAESVALSIASGPVDVSVTYIPASCTLVITPDGWLRDRELHTVSLGATLVNRGGEHLVAPFSSTFTTGADYGFTDEPPVTVATPPGGIYAAPQNVTLDCSDSDVSCTAIHYTTDGSEPTLESPVYDVPIVVSEDTVLRYFAVAFVTDVQELSQLQSYIIDADPPAVVGQVPAAGATGVLHDAIVEIAFDEPMDASTLNASTVTVEPGVAGSMEYVPANDTLVFTPHERLDCGVVFTVTVTTGAQDLAGNGLAAPHTSTFTSHADCDPPATTASALGGPYAATQSVTLTCDDGAGSGCDRILYTLDGTAPSPANATIVSGGTVASIPISVGETTLRYYAEDRARNREVMRHQHYSVSTTGFTFHGIDGVHRGAGKVPTETIDTTRDSGLTEAFAYDPISERLYRAMNGRLFASDDEGTHWFLLATGVGGYIEPHNEVIYTSGSGGLMVSVDGGGSFAPREGAPTSVVRSGRHVYGRGGPLSVSHDKGYTWETRGVADGLGGEGVSALELEGETLYVAQGDGLSVSTDFGTSFTRRTTADGLPTNDVLDVDVDGTKVYAATELGLAISTDGGASFPTLRTTADGLGHDYVKQVRAYGSQVFVAVGEPWLTPAGGTFAVSTNGGTSFTARDLTLDGDVSVYDFMLLNGVLHVGAHPSYYTSADGGTTFDLRSPPDRWVVEIRCYGGSVYAAVNNSSGHGRLMVSEDLGQTWRFAGLEQGLESNQVSGLYVGPEGVFVATRDGIGISNDGARSFAVRGEADGIAHFNTSDVVVSGGKIYVAGEGVDVSSDLTGTSFSTLYENVSISDLAIDGENIYAGTSSAVVVSNNGGVDWASTTVAGGSPQSIAVDGNGTVYVGVLNDGLFRSTDSGATFEPTSITLGGVYDIVADGSTIYLGMHEAISASLDAGGSYSETVYPDTYADGAGGCFIP
jgi:hypothetical protein